MGVNHRRDPVFISLSCPDDHNIIVEIDVFDPQTDAFRQTKTASIKDLRHKKIRVFKKGKEVMDFFACQNDWHSSLRPGADRICQFGHVFH
jgi:hypothetical protein